MTDLLKRTYSGAIYILVILAGVLIHPYVFALVFSAALILLLNEFYTISKKCGAEPLKIPGIALGLFLFVLMFLYVAGMIAGGLILLAIPAIFLIFIFELYRKKEKPLINIAVTLTGFILIALPVSLLNYFIFPGTENTRQFYPWLLIGIFFILWSYDTAAYMVGMWAGKHRLFESISPNKSWEGVIGGAVIALIVGILNSVAFQSVNLTGWIAISLTIIVFGTFGDLIESMIKRSLNVKDTGTLLPGHGGLLDRLDSLLLSIPFIFAWLLIFNN